jgi:hypothetical protein
MLEGDSPTLMHRYHVQRFVWHALMLLPHPVLESAQVTLATVVNSRNHR